MENKVKQPLFIDFEASSLNMQSYPIEVAWSLEDGSIESHLIRPDDVEGWTDWESESQEIHGLSKEYLSKHGKDPKWVANRMNEVLLGKVLLTNAYEFDLDWCETLFRAADEVMTFTFGDTWHVFGLELHSSVSVDEDGVLDRSIRPNDIYMTLVDVSATAWERIEGKQHRASVDVQQLIEMWKMVKRTDND